MHRSQLETVQLCFLTCSCRLGGGWWCLWTRRWSPRQKQNSSHLTVISVISSTMAEIVGAYMYKNASTIFTKQVVSLIMSVPLYYSFVIKGRHMSPDNLCLSVSLSSSVSSPEKPQSPRPPSCNGSAGAGPLPGCSYRKPVSGARGQSRGGFEGRRVVLANTAVGGGREGGRKERWLCDRREWSVLARRVTVNQADKTSTAGPQSCVSCWKNTPREHAGAGKRARTHTRRLRSNSP